MKLLLTGASGFFGSNLVDLLLGRAEAHREPPGHSQNATPSTTRYEIHSLQRSTRPPPTGVSAHHVDLFDTRSVAELCQQIRPTHLCHMAWLGSETTDRYRSQDNQRWVAASKGLFEAFGESGGQRLVQLGSCIEYGNAASGARVESQPLDPDTAYGEAKAELSAFVTSIDGELSTAVARPFFCYGPYEQPDRLVPSIILGLIGGQSIDLTEGRQRRDYLDVRDVANALRVLLEADVTGAFNIGSGMAVEVRSIAQRLGRIAKRTDLLNFGGRPEGADSAAEILADIGRITAATTWRPAISLEQGLLETWAWWRGDHQRSKDASGGNV